jgi:curved DNA-binding protein CbpA
MENRRNYYRVLQVQPDAPFEVIRASYYTLMRELKQHPDLGGNHWNAKVINEAYSVLSDSNKRVEYDKRLFFLYTKKACAGDDRRSPLISIFCPFCKRPLARKAAANEACPSCRSPLQSESDEILAGHYERAVERHKKTGKITYYTSWPQKGLSAELVDLSPRGLRFLSQEKVLLESAIKVTNRSFRAVAEVRNSHKVFSGNRLSYSIGAEFITVTFVDTRGGFYEAKG